MRNSLKKSLFPGDFEASELTKDNSQGFIFVIISCQRVHKYKRVEFTPNCEIDYTPWMVTQKKFSELIA